MPTAPDLPKPQHRWPWPALFQASVGVHAAALGAALLAPQHAALALGAVVVNHALLTGAGLVPRSAWLGPNLRRLPETAAPDAVALTLDDGPDREVTPRVLDLLAERGVRATFFCIAERAAAEPALLRRIVAEGHDVQNHSARHRHDFSVSGPGALHREIHRAQATIADITGRLPHCFRAPAGLRNPFLDPVLHRLGLHLVSWTRRGFDTRERDPATVFTRLSRGLAPRDILLLHDGHAGRTRDGQPVVLAVLPPLLHALQAAGLTPVTLHEAVPARHA
ncbi:MAG: polysaccharide deacetylase family protein [Rubrivivax sp.]|jgi:peptidoglycan/xylan/chitin deacetylase (PgdA/CDA1 family)|nr:polysaccharide deacetylase family protein [Rubrivivax sp.]